MKVLRYLSVMLAGLMLVLTLTGCKEDDAGDGEGTGGSEKSIYLHGLDIVRLIHEKAADDYYVRELLWVPANLIQVTEQLAKGSGKEPEAVYSVTFEFEKLDEFENEVSSELYDDLKKQMPGALIQSCLNKYGEVAIAASASLTAEKTFVSRKLSEDTVCLSYIYCFEKTYPVAVTFIKGEDNSVKAAGRALTAPELIGADSKRDFKEFFGELEYEMEKIKE